MVLEELPLPTAPPPSGANYSAEQGCFEGPEKLLEIWFAPAPTSHNSHSLADASDSDMSDISTPSTPTTTTSTLHGLGASDLRSVEKSVWDAMLATVKCTVLNVLRNDFVDAYLLSESSMFVYPHKLVIKTCGTTTLLKALPYIMEIARLRCGYDTVHRLFYSRKSFMFPEKQPGPHHSWDAEVQYLDDHFDNGAAYVIGDTNIDQWYLYLTGVNPGSLRSSHLDQLMAETDGLNWMASKNWSKMQQVRSVLHADLGYFQRGYSGHDETIEILMTQLDRSAMEPFYHQLDEPSGLVGGRRVDADTGLEAIYPDAKVDSFLFEPCGYSANGLQKDGYYTIHVTPEPQCSYASFETTIPVSSSHPNPQHCDATSARTLIRQVINVFQPGSFTVTYFASHTPKEDNNIHKLVRTMAPFDGYKRKDRILYEFEGYDLIFAHYTLLPSNKD
ncbi:S-adenosylmethionine decarboxylase [Radiomyces spectabilis]|uniref:S-adenosylmethionine decarboxylase n=1 Tax=Radiomyces spectabilis TaxID=64574 RepID=UPI00221FEDED|nr:S-adenosylmethionine decarboxylase [Radiomyces spectabilis]KAI8388411.1 S-adenosylmethionine decarboxylase [Radiomyces spectabilis]